MKRSSARAAAAERWRLRTTDLVKRVPLRLAGAVSCGVVIGCLVVARIVRGADGSNLLTPLVFTVMLFAAMTLFAVVIIGCQEWVDEMDASHPLRVRKRGMVVRAVKRVCVNAFARAERASRAWLSWLASMIAEFLSQLVSTIPTLRREVTRESLARWAHSSAAALSGIPPADVSPPVNAGPLARPRAAPRAPRTARMKAHRPRSPRSEPPQGRALASLERIHRRESTTSHAR